MKIQQNCNVATSKLTCKNLDIGTVFKCKGAVTTWLKCGGGYLNLIGNTYYRANPSEFNEDTEVDLAYPNARVVLE